MSDPVNESAAEPTSLDQQEAVYKAEAETAGKAMLAAVLAFAEAQKKLHGFIKWKQGFSAGWEASREQFQLELEKTFKEAQYQAGVALAARGVVPHATSILGGSFFDVPPSPPPMTPTANELVHQFVSENPGKRGVEIADNFDRHAFRLPERTVRTALHRLKKAGKILILDGRWYTPENVPTDIAGDPRLRVRFIEETT